MTGWNAVITVHEHGFNQVVGYLAQFGAVSKTGFFNTLVLRAEDPFALLEQLQEEFDRNVAFSGWISRFVPLQHTFSFQSVPEFEEECREAVQEWVPLLAGARFHVRMHRRGFKGRLSSMQEERFLDEFLLEKLAERGVAGKIAFDDPDVIIAIETVGARGGLSFFSRDQLKRFSLLHLE